MSSYLRRLIYFFFLFNSIHGYAQSTGDNIISWNPQQKLTVKDFRIVDDTSKLIRASAAAITRTGINYSLNASRGKRDSNVTIKIYATVHKSNSFIKKSRLDMPRQRIAYLLNHEQKHFDISEIFAREATRDIVLKKATKNYREEFLKIVQARFDDARKYQELYDKETNNGLNEQKQSDWNVIISERLKRLEQYQNKEVVKKIIL